MCMDAVPDEIGSKPIKLFVAVSAFGPIPDIGDVERFVRH